MKKIILLGVIAVMLFFTASTAMADTIVWQIGVFDYLYGVTDGTKITTSPDKSTAPKGIVTVNYTDVSTFYSVLVPVTTITGTFIADLSKGAVLLISWSPGASGAEKFSVTLDETTKSSRTVPGSICTSDPPDGRCGEVPSYYSGYDGLPYYTEIFDFGQVGLGTETHTLSINYSQGNGIGFDYLELSTPPPECVTPPPGLVSWWPGDGDAVDIVGGNNGALEGGATFVSPGKVGDAFTISGSGADYVRVSNDLNLEPTNVTVDAWVRADSTPGSARYIVAKGAQGCTAASYALYTSAGGLRFYVFNGSVYKLSPYIGPGIWDGNWHHVAGTFDGSFVRLFVDGAEVGSGTSTTISIGYSLPTDNDLLIGKYAGCSLHFNGDIDEVEIFNRALSLEEIQGIYLAGSAGKCTNQPPVAMCKDIVISVDENCKAFITPADVDDESYDPDEGDTIELSVDNTGPFSPGVYTVYLTVTDENEASATCLATVNVEDTTPPEIISVSVSPSILWPPNHKMVAVNLSTSVSDNCDPGPECQIIAVSSNEPENGLGDGDKAPDWEITGDLTVKLRAERSGTGSGRIYTITVQCMDESGNSSTENMTVTVPHDKKKK